MFKELETTIWSKYLISEKIEVTPDSEDLLFSPNDPVWGPQKRSIVVVIACIEETSGFAVWYRRDLVDGDKRGLADVSNGRYLLAFFSESKKDDAIEFAVRNVLPGNDVVEQVHFLDGLAKTAMLMRA